jgi:hypothetical protein
MKTALLILALVFLIWNFPPDRVYQNHSVVVDGHSANVVFEGTLAECLAWIAENGEQVTRMAGGDGGLEYNGRYRVEGRWAE